MFLPQDAYVRQIARDDVAGDERLPRGAALLAWAIVLGVASLLLLVIVAAPLAASANHPLLAFGSYRAFAFLCHQIPERSFHFHDAPLAVCARCWGIYSGFALGALCYPLVASLRRPVMPARMWLLVAVIPTGIDFLLGFTGLWANTHWSRALTGALLGAVGARFVVAGALEISCSKRRALLSGNSSPTLLTKQ